MKKICVIVGILLLRTVYIIQAQTNGRWQTKTIQSYQIGLSCSKTSNIVFPYAIVGVDIGSRDVLAQKAKGADNILQIKAAKKNFVQTNISIITADGKLTSILVEYAEEPSILNLAFTNASNQSARAISSDNFNEEQMKQYSSVAMKAKQKIKGVKTKSFGIHLSLDGIFIHEDLMFLRFNISNKTNIGYDVGQFRLFVRDQKKAKRTATQEIEMKPLFVYNSTNKINGRSGKSLVCVVSKFTIPDHKFLVVQIMERNGGRHLELHIKNRRIVKAVLIE